MTVSSYKLFSLEMGKALDRKFSDSDTANFCDENGTLPRREALEWLNKWNRLTVRRNIQVVYYLDP